MHTPTPSAAKQEIAHLLDPAYHRLSSSPTPSFWTDAAGGTHDPDFRPFVTSASANNTRRSSFDTGARRSFELPSAPVTPTKDERRAARRALQPDLAAALKQHEREQRPGWLWRARAKSSPALGLHDDPVPPLSVPALVVSDWTDDEDDEQHEKPHMHTHTPTGEQLRRQLASLSLKVDLAVFRAKKRIRRKVGLA
ncbi:hypothetical protein AURDEDRAFT_117369 [Auricularia subglabra TFB-10046 SS5]|uniref:Uncharacterized protein n=1 Tax=Auricularia subglabra (strain TFB-10046 / SS5) TaxID=717982 RepID=J0WRY2_AURST|nr:hypothetical protein AURDEDRAFT_117369 [Auricularia subglabra TFB-10046 SS5]